MPNETSWAALEKECAFCQGCVLGQTRTKLVFGTGSPNAEIMLIGEGPGEQEDLQGDPFVGPAGRLLDDMLRMIDLDRSKVYIANVVKCRPPRNRDPLPAEQQACRHWLDRQLGLVAAMSIIKEDFRITREHGQWFTQGGRMYMATFHPSALLRDPSKRPEAFMDLRALRKEIREICTRTY